MDDEPTTKDQAIECVGQVVSQEEPPQTTSRATEQRAATPQESRALLTPMGSSGALGQYPKSEALYGLLEVGLRGSSMVLTHTMVHELESELREARLELRELRESFRKECLTSAVLSSQLDAERKMKILQNTLLTSGGLINAAGIKLLFDQQALLHASGVVLLAVGVILTVAGWLWPKGGEVKK
jgi:hypothetical protein